MKRRIGVTILLVIALLGAGISVQAAGPRGITGGIDYMFAAYYGPDNPAMPVLSSATLTIDEVNPETGEARGRYRWWIKEIVRMDGIPNSANFDQLVLEVTSIRFLPDEDGAAVAVFCGKVVKLIGWGTPMYGYDPYTDFDYFVIGVKDAGPGDKGDAVNLYFGDKLVAWSCDPLAPDPGDACPDFDPAAQLGWLEAVHGNLTIHK
jgi:hypothetical protein